MVRWLPALIEICLVIYCLIDCAQARPERIRNLPRWAWIIMIVLLPILGSIAWLIAGRPNMDDFVADAPAGPKGPDDDPDFLRQLRSDTDQRRRLESWEDDLRRREHLLHRDDDGDSTPEDPHPSGT